MRNAKNLSKVRRGCAAGALFFLAITAPMLRADSTTISGVRDANITNASVDSMYSPSAYGLVVNVFNNTVSVIEFNTASLGSNIAIDSLMLNFQENSYANQNSNVVIYAFPHTGTITGADASASATNVGLFSAVSLGLGNHSVALAPSVLQTLVGTGQDLGLRLQSGSTDTNASFSSIEDSSFSIPPTLDVTYHLAPEPAGFSIIMIIFAGAFSRPKRRSRFATGLQHQLSVGSGN